MELNESMKLTGLWTQAGVMSCAQVIGKTRHEDFLFDCGTFETQTTTANYVFITHGHLDHVGYADKNL
jgi:ribonuclease BN (tRNA processing enzyme)